MCGNEGCYRCASEWMPVFWLRSSLAAISEPLVVCSEGCWNSFWEEIKATIDKNISVDSYHTIDGEYVSQILGTAYKYYINENPDRLPKKKYVKLFLKDEKIEIAWFYNKETYQGSEPPYAEHFSNNELYTDAWGTFGDPHQSSYRLFCKLHNHLLVKKRRDCENLLVNKARHCERVGRYEDAAEKYEEIAKLYEEWELYDKARQLRAKARQLRAKEKQVMVKQVVVDLNKLIQQVRDGGIVVVYRCPHCGGKLKIGKRTSVKSLKICEHCGSEIEAMELADFLRTALS